jgi:hypothetical protein
VSSIAAQINVADSQLYGLWLAGYDDKGLSELLAPYVDRFLKFLRREDFRDTRNLPLLIARTNDTSVLVPVDVASLRRSS